MYKSFFRCLINTGLDFDRKRSFQKASALAYSTLLSLAPLLALSMTFFAGIYPLKNISKQAQTFIIENVAPQSAEQVNAVLEGVISHLVNPSTALSVFGYVGLIITSIALFITIEEVANSVWEVRRTRPFYRSLINFWTTITFGPILLFVSIGIKIYLESNPYFKMMTVTSLWKSGVNIILPMFFSSFGFFLLFQLIPDTRVIFKYSLFCALSCSVLWELSKLGFSIYVKQAVSYENLYGSLGAIPIFLLWIYISWIITLFGFHLNFCLHRPELQALHGNTNYLITGSISWQIMVVAILFEICKQFKDGRAGPTDSDLQDKFNLSSKGLHSCLDHLFEKNLIDRIKRNRSPLKPSRPLDSLYIKDSIPENLDNEEIRYILATILPGKLHQKLEDDLSHLFSLNMKDLIKESSTSISHKSNDLNTFQ